MVMDLHNVSIVGGCDRHRSDRDVLKPSPLSPFLLMLLLLNVKMNVKMNMKMQ